MANTVGGYYEFEDLGIYIGEWRQHQAHGFGISTGKNNIGEFSGQYHEGSEVCGVFQWVQGTVCYEYHGEWKTSKRSGHGVETKNHTQYSGQFLDGMRSGYGVRRNLRTCGRYEGRWSAGIQSAETSNMKRTKSKLIGGKSADKAYGVETYTDGSTYAGEFSEGNRHGLGMRVSAEYRDTKFHNIPDMLRSSLTSIRSQNETDRIVNDRANKMGQSAFRLRGHMPSSVPFRAATGERQRQQKANSLSRTLLRKMGKRNSANDIRERKNHFGGSLRSTFSGHSHATDGMSMYTANTYDVFQDDENEDIIEPGTKETYYGEWVKDQRKGYGVCERTDGLRYEGGWSENAKHGYGRTTYANGAVEEGKYKANVLVRTYSSAHPHGLKESRLRHHVKAAVERAREVARETSGEAVRKAQRSRQQAIQASRTAFKDAEIADANSKMAFRRASELAPDKLEQYLAEKHAKLTGEKIVNGVKDSSMIHSSTQNFKESLSHTLKNPVTELLEPPAETRKSSAVTAAALATARSRYASMTPLADSEFRHKLGDHLNQYGDSGGESGENGENGEGGDAEATNEGGDTDNQPVLQNGYIEPEEGEACVAAKLEGALPAAATHDSEQVVVPDRHYDAPRSAGKSNTLERKSNAVITNGPTTVAFAEETSANVVKRRPPSECGYLTNSTWKRNTLPCIAQFAYVEPKTVSGVPFLDSTAQLLRRLRSTSHYFIIQNGVRKVVLYGNNSAATARPSSARLSIGSAESDASRAYAAQQQVTIPPTPNGCRILPQTKLSKNLGEGSIPDVTVCREIQEQYMMSREEVCRMSQERRQQLHREAERRKNGELIIRMADLRDWCQTNVISVAMVTVNLSLGMLFLFLLSSPDS